MAAIHGGRCFVDRCSIFIKVAQVRMPIVSTLPVHVVCRPNAANGNECLIYGDIPYLIHASALQLAAQPPSQPNAGQRRRLRHSVAGCGTAEA